jgi:hypothetical protein
MESTQVDGTGSRDAAGLRAGEPPGLGRNVPIVHWLPRYQRTRLRAGAIAGLTLWGVVVPEGMVCGNRGPAKAVVLDAGTQDELAVTSTEMVMGLAKQLREGGLRVYWAEARIPLDGAGASGS